MSITQAWKCDCCGKVIEDQRVAMRFGGTMHGDIAAANGGVAAWHTCSAPCAAKYLHRCGDAVAKKIAEDEANAKAQAEAKK